MSDERRVRVTDKRRSAKGAGGARSGQDEPQPAPAGAPGDQASSEQQPDYLDDLRRLQAEFDNYRKRMMKEQAALADRATARLVEKLLPVLDNFERAIAHGDVSPGVELIYKELRAALQSEGLEEIDALGRDFDPQVHEAVSSYEDDVEHEHVAEVQRPGYRFRGALVRPAMVVVARPRAHAGDEVEASADGEERSA